MEVSFLYFQFYKKLNLTLCWLISELLEGSKLAFSLKEQLIPKTIGNRIKRDCAWGCTRGINTTWENLQIEKHKSVRWADRTPSWFVLFNLQIFSGGVYPRVQPHAQSLFILFPIVFGINWFIFRWEEGWCSRKFNRFFSVLLSPVTPFDRGKTIAQSANFTKNANCFEECNVLATGKCELSAISEGRN